MPGRGCNPGGNIVPDSPATIEHRYHKKLAADAVDAMRHWRANWNHLAKIESPVGVLEDSVAKTPLLSPSSSDPMSDAWQRGGNSMELFVTSWLIDTR